MKHINLGFLEVKAAHNVSTDKFKLRIGKHWFIFYHMKKPDRITVGISNELDDGMYAFFADYDNIKYDKLRREIDNVMKRFFMSSVAVIATKEETINGRVVGNYHVISPDKFKFDELRDALAYTSCDDNFKRAPKYYSSKHWVLRIYPKKTLDNDDSVIRPKPKLKTCVIGEGSIRGKSSAILRFLETYYKVTLPHKREDGNYRIRMVEYGTCKS